jgi:hypothetical protein
MVRPLMFLMAETGFSLAEAEWTFFTEPDGSRAEQSQLNHHKGTGYFYEDLFDMICKHSLISTSLCGD